MEYVHKNINITTVAPTAEGALVTSLIAAAPKKRIAREGSVTVNKCRIANTYSAKIVVDVYTEEIDDLNTKKTYGPDYDVSLISPTAKTYYYIKSLAIPVGVSVDIFDGLSCTYNMHKALKIKLATSSDTADVALEYTTSVALTQTTTQTTTRNTRELNQY